MFKDFRCVDYNMGNMYEQAMPYKEQQTEKTCNEPRDTNMPGCVLPPVYECPIERCVHRNIMHEVPQE